jgi:hypothetical protein
LTPLEKVTVTMPGYSDHNERVDCGHYEYLEQAVPTAGGFLICRQCFAKRSAPARSHALWLTVVVQWLAFRLRRLA